MCVVQLALLASEHVRASVRLQHASARFRLPFGYPISDAVEALVLHGAAASILDAQCTASLSHET